MANGISIKGIVDTAGVVHRFDHEFLDNNPTIPDVDPTLSEDGAAAGAKETGEALSATSENLRTALEAQFTNEYEPTFSVIQGGVNVNGSNGTSNTRARTQYFDVLPNTAYFVTLDTDTYSLINPCLYSDATTGSFQRNVTDGKTDGQSLIFTTGATEVKFRVAFYHTANKDSAIEDTEYETIRSAFHIYTASLDHLETAIIATQGKTDWLTNQLISQPYGGDLTFTIGGITASTGKTFSLNTRMRTRYTFVRAGSAYRFEIKNTNYEAYWVHFYSDDSETTWLGNPYGVQDNHATFTIPDGANYIRIVFYDATDMEHVMTDSDVEALAGAFHLYQVGSYENKKERTGEFIRFTVKDNHRWTSNDSTTSDDAESSDEVDHLCILTLPTTYTPYGEKTPLIMYCHGASCGITNTTWYGNSTGEGDSANFLAMIRRFTAEGYAVFDVDNTRHVSSGFNDWGSLPLMSAYVKAWEYITKNYNVQDDLYLLSASMGTPVALNMMKWYKGRIKTAMILAPRPFGVKGRWDSEVTDARIKEFLVAWGFADDEILTDDTYVVPAKEDVFTAAVDAKYRGFYHYENMVEISGTNYVFEKFPPVKVMVGLNDPSFLTEVREYFSALQNFGNYINYREVAGKSHGAMCTLVGGELLDEGVAWFARFRNIETDEGGDEE